MARMIAAPPFCFATFAQSTFGWNSETSGRCSIQAILRGRPLAGQVRSPRVDVAPRLPRVGFRPEAPALARELAQPRGTETEAEAVARPAVDGPAPIRATFAAPPRSTISPAGASR